MSESSCEFPFGGRAGILMDEGWMKLKDRRQKLNLLERTTQSKSQAMAQSNNSTAILSPEDLISQLDAIQLISAMWSADGELKMDQNEAQAVQKVSADIHSFKTIGWLGFNREQNYSVEYVPLNDAISEQERGGTEK